MMRKEYKKPAVVEERIILGTPNATGCGIIALLVYNLCGFVALV
ncbi:MAG TPA: hypothetical protein VIO11_01275 [Candidatus Methanoperedens sp.]